ncbi:hypothetical protein [Pseudomonas sp. R5(2019)]|uniref:hypothetical protein n=1 Tax=Pseudomonas sp. R5(2019) TaxID=2697566 RepID=UPI00141267D3|nr:hypothetical protein [Pseudomonas sp. R5(2019)]
MNQPVSPGPRNGILSLTIKGKAVLYASAAGVGVQFNEGDNTARDKIETYLAGALKSDRPTHTM